MTCQRCSDCVDCQHHWLEELTYYTLDEEPIGDPIGDRVCKHCPAIGLECEECDGWGVVNGENERGQDITDDCPKCEGWGVIEVTGQPAETSPQ